MLLVIIKIFLCIGLKTVLKIIAKINEYKKEFHKNEDYIKQLNDLKIWKENCKKIKRKFIKNLKDNGIEYGSDVDDMLDNYLYDLTNDDNVWELQQGFHHFFWDLF